MKYLIFNARLDGSKRNAFQGVVFADGIPQVKEIVKKPLDKGGLNLNPYYAVIVADGKELHNEFMPLLTEDKKEAKDFDSNSTLSLEDLRTQYLSKHETQIQDCSTLDFHTGNHYWKTSEKSKYEAITQKIDQLNFSGRGWSLYGWYDVSGFEYWIRQGEQNYIQITLRLSTNELLKTEVPAILQAVEEIHQQAKSIVELTK